MDRRLTFSKVRASRGKKSSPASPRFIYYLGYTNLCYRRCQLVILWNRSLSTGTLSARVTTLGTNQNCRVLLKQPTGHGLCVKMSFGGPLPLSSPPSTPLQQPFFQLRWLNLGPRQYSLESWGASHRCKIRALAADPPASVPWLATLEFIPCHSVYRAFALRFIYYPSFGNPMSDS